MIFESNEKPVQPSGVMTGSLSPVSVSTGESVSVSGVVSVAVSAGESVSVSGAVSDCEPVSAGESVSVSEAVSDWLFVSSVSSSSLAHETKNSIVKMRTKTIDNFFIRNSVIKKIAILYS